MKKLFFICLLFASISVAGQFNTGSVYFSGLTDADLGLELSSYEFTGTQYFLPYSLNVEGGYFVKNRLAVGGSVHTHGRFALSEGASGSFEFRFGPNFRYYFPREGELNYYLYAHPYYGFVVNGDNMHGLFAGAGANYFVSENIALEGRAAYKLHRQGFGAGFSNTHSFVVEAGISVFFSSINFLGVD